MALARERNRRTWGLWIALSVLVGLVCWAFAAYDELYIRPVREPALEVSEGRPMPGVASAAPKAHIVKAGETLGEIAEKYQIDLDTLVGANEGLTELIQPGDQLEILPLKGVLYHVESGDSLSQISSMFHVDAAVILEANHKMDDFLTVGENLLIPGGKPLRKEMSSVPVSRTAAAKFVIPATGEVSSPFGWRWGRLHQGVDIADDAGTPIIAALGGKVVHAGWISGYGNTVILEHGRGYSTLYGHMQQVLAELGTTVRQGQQIGIMGSTGNSTGPHVHFEVKKNDVVVNPLSVLR